MIDIKDKKDCSGCAACASICGHGCIAMGTDSEGFPYPEVDPSACVNCGLCDRTCPMINIPEGNNISKVYAAKNRNYAERLRSSSGGVFRLLATRIINQGGIVVGCRFDDKMVAHHTIAHTKDEIEPLMSSKYVQSDTREIFAQVRDRLRKGDKVLFSGVPCQVAAIKNYLLKPYDNLITVDILCHGVPSPKIFKEYIDLLTERYHSDPSAVNFRSKEKSWKRLYLKVLFRNGLKHFLYAGYDSYMQLFLSDRLQRPSCFHCPYNTLHRPGDISLGDFWGIGKKFYSFDDNRGVSMVLINNAAGKALWESVADQAIVIESDIKTAIAGNRVLVAHLPDQSKRDRFYQTYTSEGLPSAISKYAPETSRRSQIYHNIMRRGLDLLRKITHKSY
ncbi:MAG: Coenzyme F420 hydrogenase/dehydrogenase, beta subunit C-terminal domain [Muribaculaceae bacterium]|nr:Coenzyme F420 hydrogenase/dehydrogenase, beta subunit C-terminal domain [Muribaculaceae bacterium]